MQPSMAPEEIDDEPEPWDTDPLPELDSEKIAAADFN